MACHDENTIDIILVIIIIIIIFKPTSTKPQVVKKLEKKSEK